MYDIIIIGAGPAGLCAAVYARRAKKSVLLIEKSTIGGQMTYSPKIENFPGEAEISGAALADKMLGQALALGADMEIATVTGIADENGIKTVKTEDGEIKAQAVIIAAGVRHRMLGVEGENELVGSFISFCAVCDGAFYRDRTVAVIGGGNSALQEALLLADVAKSVTVVQNLDYLTGEAALQERLIKKPNVKVITGAVVDSFADGGIVIRFADSSLETLKIDGMFVAIGLIPENGFASDVAALDKQGYIISDENCLTSADGVFVAGDCRSKKVRQITTAVADGASAALAAIDFCNGEPLRA